MNRETDTVIVSGGTLEEEFALPILKSRAAEMIIGVDRGLEFLHEHGIRPHHIVGDFDSVSPEILQKYEGAKEIGIHRFRPQKDASDTEIALRLCVELKRRKICLLGATGSRLDHTWANVQSLKIALDAGVEAEILDAHNRVRLLQKETVLKRKDAYGTCFSVFPLGGPVEGFSISGAKYPLSNHTLLPFGSLCVSNEFAADEVKISFPQGNVVLIESRD